MRIQYNELDSIIENTSGLQLLRQFSIEMYNVGSRNLHELFKKTPNLQYLSLRRDKIRDKSITIDSLLKLKSLKMENITQKNIAKFLLDSEKFVDLEEINLLYNKIRNLQEDFNNFVNLKRFSVTQNYGLKSIIFNKDKLSNLEFLDLSDNRIIDFPDSIENLVNLKTLILYNNNITIISEKLYGLTKLTMLNLAHNKLKKLSDSIGNLHNLQLLNISKNKNLKKLPASISKLKEIKQLYISGIGLETYPVEFCYFSKLERLVMNNNNIETIPNEIVNLTSLNYLSIRMNNISSLPIEIKLLKNYNKFDIYHDSYSNSLSPECEYYQSKNLLVALDNLPVTLKEIRLYKPSCRNYDDYYKKPIKIPFGCKLYIDDILITEETLFDIQHYNGSLHKFINKENFSRR